MVLTSNMTSAGLLSDMNLNLQPLVTVELALFIAVFTSILAYISHKPTVDKNYPAFTSDTLPSSAPGVILDRKSVV